MHDKDRRTCPRGPSRPTPASCRDASRCCGTRGPGCPCRGRSRPRRTAQRHRGRPSRRSEEHTSELQSLMRISYAVFCLKKKKQHTKQITEIKKQSEHQKQQDK